MRRAIALSGLLITGVLAADSATDEKPKTTYCRCLVFPIVEVEAGYWAFYNDVYDDCTTNPCTGRNGALSIEYWETAVYPQTCGGTPPCMTRAAPPSADPTRPVKAKPIPPKLVDADKFGLNEIMKEFPSHPSKPKLDAKLIGTALVKFQVGTTKIRYAKLFDLRMFPENELGELRPVRIGFEVLQPLDTSVPDTLPATILLTNEPNVCSLAFHGNPYAVRFKP